MSATNLSQFAQPKKHHGKQCVRNNVSSFTGALRPWQKRTHCCGHIVADTNVSPFARARNICYGHKKCLILFRNILSPQQMFPSLRSSRNSMGNNVSATTCPRLPGPLLLPAKCWPLLHVIRGGLMLSLKSQRVFQNLLLLCLVHDNKSLNDWSHGEQWILFPENLNIFRDEVEGNIEIRGKQNSLLTLFPLDQSLSVKYHAMENTVARWEGWVWYSWTALIDGKVRWNTDDYTMAFLHSDWLYFLWHGIISNYWMRLSRIWRILQIKGVVIHREVDNTLRDLQNSLYPTKAEFNNCFIIHLKYCPGSIICSGLHFWRHFDVIGSIIFSGLHFWRHRFNIWSTAAGCGELCVRF